MSKFINILGNRIILTSIKRYRPLNSTKLVIWYTSTRQKIDNEIFVFENTEQRNAIIASLDEIFIFTHLKPKE